MFGMSPDNCIVLNKEDALGFEFYISGRSKSKQYLYQCLLCSGTIKVRSNKLDSHSGLCFDCALRKRTLRPYESTYNAMAYRHSSKCLPGALISYEEFLNFTKIEECHYCSRRIFWSRTRNGRLSGRVGCVNLDRLDSSIGYVSGNLVVCCWSCNFVRQDVIPYGAMLEIGPILARYGVQGRSRIREKKTKVLSDRSSIAHRGQSVSNMTGFRGVHVDRARGQFVAKSKKNGRVIFLGRFDKAEDAARAYDKYALETFGSFANLNFPLQTSSVC